MKRRQEAMARLTIAVDFDATIASYDGFQGKGNFGAPVQNAKWALDLIKNEWGHTIIINTCRLEIDEIAAYLNEHEIPFDHINFNPENIKYDLHPAKVRADIYIDDKNVAFRGDWREAISNVAKFRNWSDDEGGAIRGGGEGI